MVSNHSPRQLIQQLQMARHEVSLPSFVDRATQKKKAVEVGATDQRAFETNFEPQDNNLHQII